MTGEAGKRTMIVELTDMFGNKISDEVTVQFDPDMPLYSWIKVKNWNCKYKNDGSIFRCSECDESDTDHAAKWETSILWYLRPELVDIYRLPRDTDEPLDGIYGDDPRVHASREIGKQAVEAIAEDLAALGKKLLA